MVRRFASLCGLTAALLIPLACLAAASPLLAGEAAGPDPRAVIAESVRSLRLQTELPGVKRAEPEKPTRAGGGSSPANAASATPSIANGSATILLWIAVAVFVLILAMILAEHLRLDAKRPKAGKPDEAGDAARAAARERAATARNDADALAEEANYADAMHVLLLQSLDEMRRLLRVSFASSLTAREILHHTRLEAPAREALSDIVGRVEISHFGTHRPGRDDYLACRRSHAALIDVLRRGGRV